MTFKNIKPITNLTFFLSTKFAPYTCMFLIQKRLYLEGSVKVSFVPMRLQYTFLSKIVARASSLNVCASVDSANIQQLKQKPDCGCHSSLISNWLLPVQSEFMK